MAYRSSYELELDYGFALLEQLEGPHGAYRYRPESDDGEQYDNIFFSGFYGGSVDPRDPQEFLVYSLEWPEDLEDVDDEIVETLVGELNSLFPGWVFDRRRGHVYIVADGDDLIR